MVTKERLARALDCAVHRVTARPADGTFSVAMACGALVDALFRQLVTVGGIGDPMADGLAALAVDDRQGSLTAWIERLPVGERAELRAEVDRQAAALQRRWPRLEPAWLPRTQEVLRVPLGGGTVQLATRVDLAIGTPAVDEASVAIVEVKSGARRAQHRADLHFSALVETLRSTAPPFVVATYYTRTGELDVDPVTEEILSAAARRTLIGSRVLLGQRNGVDHRPPGTLCTSCPALPVGDDGTGWEGSPTGPRTTDRSCP